jgi:hypothetical protein
MKIYEKKFSRQFNNKFARKKCNKRYLVDGEERKKVKLAKLRKHVDNDVRSWDNIIENESFFDHLSVEAKIFWSLHGGDKGSAKSFWISKTQTPKNALELFAQRVATFHCSRGKGKFSYIIVDVYIYDITCNTVDFVNMTISFY